MENLKTYLGNWMQSKSLLAVSICSVEGSQKLNVLEIAEFKNSEIQIKSQVLGINPDEFFNTFNSKYPVLLNIEGDAILSKKLNRDQNYKESLLLRDSLEEYHFYKQETKNHTFVSYCNNKGVDAIINQFLAKDFFITHVTLGPFVVNNLLPFLPELDAICTKNHIINLDNREMVSFSAKEIEAQFYDFGDSTISNEITTALGVFFSDKLEDTEENNIIINNKQEIKFKRLLFVLAPILLIAIMAALVIGHFQKKHKAQQLELRQSELSFAELNKQNLNSLEKDRDYKESVLFSSGFNIVHPFSVQVADLVNTLPTQIILDEIEVQPLSRKQKENEKIELSTKRIKVSGQVVNDSYLDNWIKEINSISWVKKVANISFEENRTNQKKFNLIITTL